MKVMQVVGKPGVKWTGQLQEKERSLRNKGTTLVRVARHKWRHKRHPGTISWDESVPGVLVAKIWTRIDGEEWQILNSFLGYLNRHFGDDIQSIAIHFR